MRNFPLFFFFNFSSKFCSSEMIGYECYRTCVSIMLSFVSLVNDAIDWLSFSSASSVVQDSLCQLCKKSFCVTFVGAEHSKKVFECFLLLE